MMGYKGPKNESLMSSFIESNPAAGAKMGQFMSASKGFNKGGTVGYATGGYVMGSNNSILKPDGSVYKTYGSLSEAYQALQSLNNPTSTNTGPVQSGFNQVPDTGPNTSTGGSTTQQPTAGYQPTTTTAPNTQQQAGYDQYRSDLNNLYTRYLGRGVQDAGLNFYGQHLQSGNIDLAGVEADIRQSPEARQYADRTISSLYQNVLGREADQAGLEYYRNQFLSGNLTLHQIRQQLNNAATGVNAQAPGTQTSGPPVAGGQGTTTPGATANLTNQTEAEQFQKLRNAYRDIFGRNPDQAGMDYYMQQLASGRSEEDILNELIRSEEAQLISNGRYNEAKALREAQQNFLNAAYQSPQDLVTGQEVASMQVQEGELVDPNTGRVSTTAPGYQATTIDPTTGQAVAPADIGTATYEAVTPLPPLPGPVPR
jgi:hypothetical protein